MGAEVNSNAIRLGSRNNITLAGKTAAYQPGTANQVVVSQNIDAHGKIYDLQSTHGVVVGINPDPRIPLAGYITAVQDDTCIGGIDGDIIARYPGQLFRTLSLIHISEPTRLGMISYAVFCL